MKTTRDYRMGARAQGVREREEAILEAAFDAFLHEYFDLVTIRAIAEAAGVTEQTVIRRFGSKEDLLAACVERFGPRLGGERREVAQNDYRAAVASTVDAYETWGRETMHILAQEDRTPALRRVAERGRSAHRELTAEHFASWLPAPTHRQYDTLLAGFVLALDVYTWKLFRIDHGMTRDGTEAAITHIVESLIAASPFHPEDDHDH